MNIKKDWSDIVWAIKNTGKHDYFIAFVLGPVASVVITGLLLFIWSEAPVGIAMCTLVWLLVVLRNTITDRKPDVDIQNTADNQLTAHGLKLKYTDGIDPLSASADDDRPQHPIHTLGNWVCVVASRETDLGYWEWVKDRVQALDIDEEVAYSSKCSP